MTEQKHPCAKLSAMGIQKSYTKKGRPVVHDISLSIDAGEIVGLLGPNGAGKTTTFYILVGLVQGDLGTIHLNDTDITYHSVTERAQAGLGYLPQESSIFKKMTIEENILAILQLQRKLSPTEQKNRCDALIDEFKLNHVAHSLGLSVSGGERRRAEIARAMASDPQFILLDEPFAGIDPIAIIDLKKIITYLSKKGVGILITDHNVQDTLTICEKAYIVNNGEIIAEGSPQKIASDPQVQSVYLGKGFQLNPSHQPNITNEESE